METLYEEDEEEDYEAELTCQNAEEAINALEKGSKLAALTVEMQWIGLDGIRRLATALRDNHSLKTVNLPDNYLRPEDAAEILRAVEGNSTLTSLDLTDNRRLGQGHELPSCLGSLLTENSTLKSLHLMNTGIDDEGATQLGWGLQCNDSLTSLDLRHNNIGHGGMQELLKALEVNVTLIDLKLAGNEGCSSNGNTKPRMQALLERNKEPTMVLSVWSKPAGEERVLVTCTTMGGTEVFRQELPVRLSLKELKLRVLQAMENSQTKRPIHLVLPNGSKLLLKEGARSMGEVLR